jgi:uncharacterized protein
LRIWYVEAAMTVDHIRYDILAQEALRGMVRRLLTDVAKKGLPGEHHFYIRFDTKAAGVRMSQRLREEYPEEMTVVLQHQFWDLAVTDQAFEVGLAFHGVPELLVVPFAAIRGFLDPSVQFGLEFETIADETVATGEASPGAAAGKEPATLRPATPEGARKLPAADPVAPAATADADAKAAEPGATTEGEPDPPSGGAEVVRLDRFRKK